MSPGYKRFEETFDKRFVMMVDAWAEQDCNYYGSRWCKDHDHKIAYKHAALRMARWFGQLIVDHYDMATDIIENIDLEIKKAQE